MSVTRPVACGVRRDAWADSYLRAGGETVGMPPGNVPCRARDTRGIPLPRGDQERVVRPRGVTCRKSPPPGSPDPERGQHDLEDDQQDDGDFEELTAGHARVFDGEAVDVVERLQLLVDVGFPAVEAEPCGGQAEQARG